MVFGENIFIRIDMSDTKKVERQIACFRLQKYYFVWKSAIIKENV